MTPPGIDPETVRLVAQCLNHYATPGPHKCLYQLKMLLLIKLRRKKSDARRSAVLKALSRCSIACIYTCGRHDAAVAGSTWKHGTAEWVEILTKLATQLSVVRQ